MNSGNPANKLFRTAFVTFNKLHLRAIVLDHFADLLAGCLLGQEQETVAPYERGLFFG